MNKFDYSVIIPAYNEANELPTTLAAVKLAMAQQSESGQCIVVDNNSSDATTAIAHAQGADQVVFEPINQIARARNAGAAASQGRYLIFIDADTRIEPALLTESLRRLAQTPCVGGGSVIQFDAESSAIGRAAIFLWERISRLTRTAAGSYIFCQREAFESIGGFDQKLYAGEEVRFSRLLRNLGKRHQQTFDILTHSPAITSARKLNWYSGPQILGWILLMLMLPLAVRSRKLCGFWYNRPKN
jgi:glycosyltransferase involved in cell wall biosynthesis